MTCLVFRRYFNRLKQIGGFLTHRNPVGMVRAAFKVRASRVLVGAGIGWLIDRLLGISPWGLTVFLLLGFAAGVLNVMRSAGLVASPTLNDRSRQGSDR